MPKRLVTTPEGFIVDAETGEVVEEVAIDYRPEYRVFSDEDRGKIHYAPMKTGHVPKAETTLNMLKAGASPHDVELRDLKRISKYVGIPEEAGESRAFEVGGLRGLAIYRCLKNMGFRTVIALKAVELAFLSGEGRGKVYSIAKSLKGSITKALSSAFIRWNSRFKDPIDVDLLKKAFSKVVDGGAAKQKIVIVNGIKVQVTASKVDISVRRFEEGKVYEVLDVISRKLGVELFKPVATTATITLRLPFMVFPKSIPGAVEGGLSSAVIMAGWYKAMVYPKNLVIYVTKLRNDLSLLDFSIADCLPKVCRATAVL